MDKSSSSESESGSESSSGEDSDSASERARKVLLLQEQVRNLSLYVAIRSSHSLAFASSWHFKISELPTYPIGRGEQLSGGSSCPGSARKASELGRLLPIPKLLDLTLLISALWNEVSISSVAFINFSLFGFSFLPCRNK